ncbi:Zinc finger SWIM domain-containing protein 8, partial [Cichlidogyrus casuarinus]
ILRLQEDILSLLRVLSGSSTSTALSFDARTVNFERWGGGVNQPQSTASDPALFVSAHVPRQEAFHRRNKWSRLDVELAFRLGTVSLSLPRLPASRPALEIRLFDLESTILNLLCRLPLSTHCPHALDVLRKEAKSLTRLDTLDPIRKSLMVPFSLSMYVFHQLAGAEMLRNSTSTATPSASPQIHIAPERVIVPDSELLTSSPERNRAPPYSIMGMAPSAPELRNNVRQPGSSCAHYCINYGAFVVSSGIPLAKAIQDVWKLKNDTPSNAVFVGGSESASLDLPSQTSKETTMATTTIIRYDEEAAFQAALSALKMRSILPAATFGINSSPLLSNQYSAAPLGLFCVQLEAQRIRYFQGKSASV